MDETQQPADQQRQRLKLAVIPVLVVVLGAVLWRNQNENEAVPTLLKPPPTVGNVAPDQRTTSAAPSVPVVQARTELSLQEVRVHNPFLLSQQLVPRQVEGSQAAAGGTEPLAAAGGIPVVDPRLELIAALQALKPSAYYRSDAGPVGVLDGRVIREGDKLDAGIKVSRILPEQVILELEPQ